MRPTYNLLLAMAESSPTFRDGCSQLGVPVPQAVAQIFDRFSGFREQATRDAFLAQFAGTCDMHVTSEQHFSKAADDLIARLDPLDKRDARISETARLYGFDPERIKQLHAVASKASLQQATSDRFRDRDAAQTRHEAPAVPRHDRARMQGEDARDLRSAVHAAVAGSHDNTRRLQVTNATDATPLRDIIAASFDGHAQLDAERDPLQDEGLRSLSDAV